MPKRDRCGDAVVDLETAVITQITGAAKLHMVLMRVLFAENAFDVLGLEPEGFTGLALDLQFATISDVVHPCNVRQVLVDKKLYDVLMPFAWKAYKKMKRAKDMLDRQLEQRMLARLNSVITGTGRQYAFARDM